MGVNEKKLKRMSALRANSELTTRFGAVAINVIIPLISPATLNGIINPRGEIFIFWQITNTTGIKIATTPVELIKEPSPATANIK